MSQRIKDYISRIIVVMAAVGLVAGFLFAPSVYRADDSQTALVSNYTMYSGTWNIAGPYRNATSSLIDETYVGWENDGNNYFTMKNSSGTYYPPNNLCKFYFKISGELLVEASGDLLVDASCRPYIVYNGERYEAFKVDGNYICSFYAQGNSNIASISTPVQFDVDVYDNATSSSSYSVTFQLKSIVWSCWSVEEEEEALFNTMITYLESIASDNDIMRRHLANISSSASTMVTKLTSLNNYASGILTGVNNLTTEIQELQSLVEVTNDYLVKIQAELEEQTAELQKQSGILSSIGTTLGQFYGKFLEFIGVEEEPAPEELDNTGITDITSKQDAILGGADNIDVSTSVSVTIDADASNSIWNIVNNFISLHGDVFAMFITMLSLGVVGLILGR